MNLKLKKIYNPENFQLILGQAHFIQTLDQIYEAIKHTIPNGLFSVGYCESSDLKKIMIEGVISRL